MNSGKFPTTINDGAEDEYSTNLELPPPPASFNQPQSHSPFKGVTDFNNTNAQTISPEQFEWFMNQITPSERQNMMSKARSCNQERLFRSMATAAGISGIHYLASQAKLVARQPFPFYAVLGIGTVTASAFLNSSQCDRAVQNDVVELHKKYLANGGASNVTPTTYDALRETNRRRGEQEFLPARHQLNSLYNSPSSSKTAKNNYNAEENISDDDYQQFPMISGTPFSTDPHSDPYNNDNFNMRPTEK